MGGDYVLGLEGSQIPDADSVVSGTRCNLIAEKLSASFTILLQDLPVGREVHCQDLLDMTVEHHSRPPRSQIPNSAYRIEATTSKSDVPDDAAYRLKPSK